MRTASICPTCATFENALCVLYNGAYLTNTKIALGDSLETALGKINSNLVPLTGTVAPTTNAIYLGQQYLNTVTNQLYYAKSVGAGASDWTLSVNGAAGQVGFYSTAYNVVGDNSLFWDNSNKRLGIGTIIPSYKLDVSGNGRFTSSVIATYFQNTGQNAFYLTNAGNNDFTLTGSGVFRILNNTQTTPLFSVTNAGVATFVNTVNAVNFVGGSITTTADGIFNEVRVGKGAGQINSNTVVGQYALTGNTSGYQNTALGFTAMQLNGVGYQNTAVGAYALASNGTGNGNTAIGNYALTLSAAGLDNVAIGKDSLRAATGALRCVAIGEESMYTATVAVHSVGIGYKSLPSGGTSNVAVGYQSGNGGQASTSVGFESLRDNTGLYNTGVGYRSLYINSTGEFNTALGYRSLQANQIGIRNTSLGSQSLYNSNGSYNIAIGYDAGRYVTTDGGAANTGSTSCIYIGYKTLAATATDTNAIVIGNGALSLGNNTTIIGNAATTKTAIRGNVLIGTTTSATSNLAKLEVLGGNSYFSVGEDQNAFSIYNDPNGCYAFRYNGDEQYVALQETSGNVLIGLSSVLTADKLQVKGDGYFTNPGGANISVVATAAGSASLTLTSNTTGSQKAIINAPLASGKLVLQTNSLDRITIGSTGNTWIGGTSTFTTNTAKLEVTGSIASTTLSDTYIPYSNAGILTNSTIIQYSNGTVLFRNDLSSNATIKLEKNNQVGIAMTSESGINDFLIFNEEQYIGDNVFQVQYNGDTYNLNGIYGSPVSDIRLKENIVPSTSKLDDILKLNVVNFNYKSDKNNEKKLGFIAQEFEQVFPSLVTVNDTRKYNDGGDVISGYEDSRGLKVGMEFAIFTKAIQEQQEIIKNLQTQIDELKSKI